MAIKKWIENRRKRKQEERARYCETNGHVWKRTIRRGWRYPDYGESRRMVAYSVTETRLVCRRCGFAEEPKTTEEGFTGFSHSSEFCERMEEARPNPVWSEY